MERLKKILLLFVLVSLLYSFSFSEKISGGSNQKLGLESDQGEKAVATFTLNSIFNDDEFKPKIQELSNKIDGSEIESSKKKKRLRTLTRYININRVRWTGGQDADVWTKPNKSTRVTIKFEDLRLTNDRTKFLAHVLYTVEEVYSNYTTLEYEGDVSIQVPYAWRNKRIEIGKVSDFTYNDVIQGENHSWNNIEINTENTFVNSVKAKIDGPGRDDNGNAALKFRLKIPVYVE